MTIDDVGHTSGSSWIQATATNYEDAEVLIIAQDKPEIGDAKKSSAVIRSASHRQSYFYNHRDFDIGIKEKAKITNGINEDEIFTLFEYDDGYAHFRTENGAYLSAANNLYLVNTSEVSAWETFKLLPATGPQSVYPGNRTVKIQAVNGQCFMYDYDDTVFELNDDCTTIETDWNIVDLDAYPISQLVHIRSKSTNQYITAYGGNNWPKIRVNRDTPGSLETFMMTSYPNNTISLKTYPGYYLQTVTYISGEDATARTLTGDSETPKKYASIFNSDDSVIFRDYATNYDLVVEANGRLSPVAATVPDDNDFYIEEYVIDEASVVDVYDENEAKFTIPIPGTEGVEAFIINGVQGIGGQAVEVVTGIQGTGGQAAEIVQSAFGELVSVNNVTATLSQLPGMGMFSSLDGLMPLRGSISYMSGANLKKKKGTDEFPTRRR